MQTTPLNTRRRLGTPSDRTTNRLIKLFAIVLVAGIPAFAAFYYFDRHVDVGPTQIQRTVSAAEAAVRSAPNNLGSRLDLAAAYVTASRFNDALAQLNEVLKAEPTNRAALMGRGGAYLSLGKLTESAADYQAVIDMSKNGEMAASDPQLELALYSLGQIRLKEGKAADAVPLLNQAVNIDGGDADALFALGTALVKTGDPTTGVLALRRSTAFVPTGWCEPYVELQAAYEALGKVDGATYAAGMVAFCQGLPDAGMAKLKPLTGGPFALDALVGLGLIAEQQRDPADATSYYEQALTLDPKNFLAITGLNRLATPSDNVAPHGSSEPSQAPASPAAGGNG